MRYSIILIIRNDNIYKEYECIHRECIKDWGIHYNTKLKLIHKPCKGCEIVENTYELIRFIRGMIQNRRGRGYYDYIDIVKEAGSVGD